MRLVSPAGWRQVVSSPNSISLFPPSPPLLPTSPLFLFSALICRTIILHQIEAFLAPTPFLSSPLSAFFLSLGVVLGLEPRALCLLAMSSLTNAYSQGLVPVWIAAVVMDYCDCQFTLSFLAYHCSWAFFRFYVAICILCVIYLSCAFVHYSIKLFCFPSVEYINSNI